MERLLMIVVLLKVGTSYQQQSPGVNKGTSPPRDIPGHIISEVARLAMSDWKYKELVTSLTGAVVLSCGPGWTYFEDHCYWFSRQETNWQDAREHCQNLDADLVDINGFQENRIVKSIMRNIRKKEHPSTIKYYFLGGTDQRREGRWIWITNGKGLGFTDWESGEPSNSNGNEDCIAMSGETFSSWNDVPCSENYLSICKKSVGYKMLP